MISQIGAGVSKSGPIAQQSVPPGQRSMALGHWRQLALKWSWSWPCLARQSELQFAISQQVQSNLYSHHLKCKSHNLYSHHLKCKSHLLTWSVQGAAMSLGKNSGPLNTSSEHHGGTACHNLLLFLAQNAGKRLSFRYPHSLEWANSNMTLTEFHGTMVQTQTPINAQHNISNTDGNRQSWGSGDLLRKTYVEIYCMHQYDQISSYSCESTTIIQFFQTILKQITSSFFDQHQYLFILVLTSLIITLF